MKPQTKLTKDELKEIERVEKFAKLLYNLDLNLKDNVERINGQLYLVSKAVPPKAPDFLKKR
jgi:hypothetical protein